jgi:hypothetical protein
MRDPNKKNILLEDDCERSSSREGEHIYYPRNTYVIMVNCSARTCTPIAQSPPLLPSLCAAAGCYMQFDCGGGGGWDGRRRKIISSLNACVFPTTLFSFDVFNIAQLHAK